MQDNAGELNLPSDLVAFLKAGRQLEYDPEECDAGRVTLHRLEDLKLRSLKTRTEGTPYSADDPYRKKLESLSEKEYEVWCDSRRLNWLDVPYEVPGVSLTASAEEFDPDGLLVWLPNERQFGVWDGDHAYLMVFSHKVTWSDITANPAQYINSQWDPPGRGPSEWFCPYPRYYKELEW